MVEKVFTSFETESLIEQMLNSELLNVRTCIPVIVVDVSGDVVDVEIVVERVLVGGTTQGVARLLGIPILHIGNADYGVSFPVAVGDEGLALFSDRDIQLFLESGKQSAPSMLRNHDLSDAVYLPTNLSKQKRVGKIDPSALLVTAGTSGLTINKDGAIEVAGNLDVTGDISATGDITTPGDVVAGTISLKLHTHPVSGASTGVPVP